jgi:hypothetical protein
MQQRQLRLGDILDDYCTRERRVTNHAVVAMVGPDVKQTRCTTCETEHEYKHAKVPRQRRKADTPAALYSQVLAGGPKRVVHEEPPQERDEANRDVSTPAPEPVQAQAPATRAHAAPPDRTADPGPVTPDDEAAPDENEAEEGPVHRPLIRATLPRTEGQPPPTRPAPDFTIRQPGGRQNRFRHGGQARAGQFQGNRSSGGNMGGQARGGMPRHSSGRQPPGPMTSSRPARPRGHGQKRSK